MSDGDNNYIERLDSIPTALWDPDDVVAKLTDVPPGALFYSDRVSDADSLQAAGERFA